MKKKLIGLSAIILFQSCLFGVGLIEEEIAENIFLFALNDYNEASIWYKESESSITSLLVPEAVFHVEYNDDFIIARSHPKNVKGEINKNLTYYHIIEIENVSQSNPEQSTSLLKEQFEYMREGLGIPDEFDYDIIIKDNQ